MFEFKTEEGLVSLSTVEVLELMRAVGNGPEDQRRVGVAECLMECLGLHETSAWDIVYWISDNAWHKNYQAN